MGLADRLSQSVGRVRNGDEVDMGGHQAVGPDLDLVDTAPLRHELEVRSVILIAKKSLLAAVSPLRDVVRQARCDNSCQLGHERRLSTSGPGGNNFVWCPPNASDGAPWAALRFGARPVGAASDTLVEVPTAMMPDCRLMTKTNLLYVC
jgi:hypothetical protein